MQLYEMIYKWTRKKVTKSTIPGQFTPQCMIFVRKRNCKNSEQMKMSVKSDH